jgi:hypothetical protein
MKVTSETFLLLFFYSSLQYEYSPTKNIDLEVLINGEVVCHELDVMI